jgi:23S rRNA (guanosine2251-2'-O)-methyltransferase
MKRHRGNRPDAGWPGGRTREEERRERAGDAGDASARKARSERPVRESSPGERVARAFDGERRGAAPSRPRFDDTRPPTQGRERADESQLFGVQPVLEALRAGRRPVERLTIAEGVHERRLDEIFELARRDGIPIRRAPRAELQRLVGGAFHQGVVATIAAARYHPADKLLDELAARVGTDDPPLVVVLDGVEDPRNLGAVIRTVECVGGHGVFVPERRAAGLTETAAKAAAGALEYVPVARAANVSRLVDELKERGVWTVGTAVDADVSYTEWDWTQPCALLLGGEGEGLRRLVREHCDALVRIPMRGRVESLNVSVAAGVVLFEALRQRSRQ